MCRLYLFSSSLWSACFFGSCYVLYYPALQKASFEDFVSSSRGCVNSVNCEKLEHEMEVKREAHNSIEVEDSQFFSESCVSLDLI